MSLTERLRRTFTANRRKWIAGRYLSSVGGYGGFRSRISDLRSAGMRIVCKTASVKRRDGSYATTSWYRYLGRQS